MDLSIFEPDYIREFVRNGDTKFIYRVREVMTTFSMDKDKSEPQTIDKDFAEDEFEKAFEFANERLKGVTGGRYVLPFAYYLDVKKGTHALHNLSIFLVQIPPNSQEEKAFELYHSYPLFDELQRCDTNEGHYLEFATQARRMYAKGLLDDVVLSDGDKL